MNNKRRKSQKTAKLTASNCKHFEICGLESILNSADQCCILHSSSKEKNVSDFQEVINSRILEKNYLFDYVVFPPSVCDFVQFIFESDTSFKGAVFLGDTNFSSAIFNGDVSFAESTFCSEANFSQAKFNGNANKLNQVKFLGDAHFYETYFDGITDFRRTTFEGIGNFVLTQFNAEAHFEETVFSKRAHFHQAAFRNTVSFHTALFKDLVAFVGKKDTPIFSDKHETNFESVLFEEPHRVFFDSVDLSKCTLIRTDLREVNFTKVKWAKIRSRLALYDEIIATKGRKSDDYPLVEELYTLLKQHWEDEKNFEIACFFHYGEKEMRRRSRKFWNDPILWLYWLFSGYSELATRAFLWILLIWIGFAYYYSLTNISLPPTQNIIESLHLSLQVMTLQAEKSDSIAQTIQGLLGPLQIALFALAVRRRLNR